MKIRLLNADEICEIYNTHLVNSFPRSEVKPLENILRMREQKKYECLGLYESDELRGYAYMVVDRESNYLLLDYLAIVAEKRGCGYGSRLLKDLREWYQDRNGIYIESEALRTSADEDEMIVRRRRLDFYENNGCELTCIKTYVYGVEYSIFYIPLLEQSPDHDAQLEHIYRTMFSEKAYASHVRAWRRSLCLRFVKRWDSEKGQFVESPSLMAALHFRADAFPRVIALTGGGGKTSSMFQLADELAECGKRVLVTTTTHFNSLRPDETDFVETSSEITGNMWEKRRIVTAGKKADAGKLAMPEGMETPEEVRRLLDLCDVILTESDGAARRPLKVPREGEPVYLPGTEAVIACAGLSGIGETFSERCFRFTTEGSWLNRGEEDRILPEDVAQILSSDRGGRKGLSELENGENPCEFRILLNQADDEKRLSEAAQVVGYLPERLRKFCVATNYRLDDSVARFRQL